MIRFAENLNKMIAAGLGGALEAPRTEVAVGHRIRYLESSGAVANFETNIVAPIRNLRVDMQPIQAGSGDPSPDNIRPITGRDAVTVYRSGSDMSNPQIVTVQLGQTVYGGTIDITTGTVTVDRVMVDLGTLTWTKLNNYVYGTFTSNIISNCVYSSTAIYWMCDTYKAKCNQSVNASGDNYIWIRLPGGEKRVVIKDTSMADMTAEEFTAAMSGKMFIYTLETPQTITLTPEQLSTLKGQNNVWSDAGDVALKYPYYEETEGY